MEESFEEINFEHVEFEMMFQLRVWFNTYFLSLEVDSQDSFDVSSNEVEEASCPLGENYCMGICCSACVGKSIVSFDDPSRWYGRENSYCQLVTEQERKPSIIWCGNNNIDFGDERHATFLYTMQTSVYFFLREDDKVIIGLIFTCVDGNSIIVRNHVAYAFCGKEFSCCIAGDGPRNCQLVLNDSEKQIREERMVKYRLRNSERKRRKSICSLRSMDPNNINHAIGQESQNVSPIRKINSKIARETPRDTTIHVASKACGKEFSSCAAGDGPQKRMCHPFNYIYVLRHRLKKIHFDHLKV
jgi:hypothetical protein